MWRSSFFAVPQASTMAMGHSRQLISKRIAERICKYILVCIWTHTHTPTCMHMQSVANTCQPFRFVVGRRKAISAFCEDITAVEWMARNDMPWNEFIFAFVVIVVVYLLWLLCCYMIRKNQHTLTRTKQFWLSSALLVLFFNLFFCFAFASFCMACEKQ